MSLAFKNKEEITVISKYLNSHYNYSQKIELDIIASSFRQIDLICFLRIVSDIKLKNGQLLEHCTAGKISALNGVRKKVVPHFINGLSNAHCMFLKPLFLLQFYLKYRVERCPWFYKLLSCIAVTELYGLRIKVYFWVKKKLTQRNWLKLKIHKKVVHHTQKHTWHIMTL